MHRNWWRLAFALLALSPLGLVGLLANAQPMPPSSTPPPLPADATVVVRELINPRGFTWGPDGSLYVAEAGTPPAGYMMSMGGPPQPNATPVTNMNGRISRVAADGTRTTVAEGFPLTVGPQGDPNGVSSLAFVDGVLYAALSAGPVHGHPDIPSGIYRIGMDGSRALVADTDAFNQANPPAFIPGDDEISNPYDMVALGGKLYTTDGNRSVIWEIDPQTGDIRYLADLSVGHPVITGIAAGPDGNLYVTNLTPAPFPPAGAKVWRVSLSGTVTEVASGISAGTGIAVGPDGTIYVSEFAQTPGAPPFFRPPGRVVRVGADGAITPVATDVFFPTMLRWGPDGLYTTYFSVGGNAGNGAILRLSTTAATPTGTPGASTRPPTAAATSTPSAATAAASPIAAATGTPRATSTPSATPAASPTPCRPEPPLYAPCGIAP